jgi:predicted RNA-binding protein YlqC (UPF0109 family)
MKKLILRIARMLVDKPECVTITESGGDQHIVLELQVEKSEMGKVIGKQGRTVEAMRTLLNAVAPKVKKRVMLLIVETIAMDCHARQGHTESVIVSGGRLIPVSTRRPVDRERRCSN